MYGRMEVRAKIPTALGVWPAIWMVGTDTPKWPDKGEIDIMEYVGWDTLTIYGTLHALTTAPNPPKPNFSKGGKIKAGADLFNSFHVYAIEWYKDRIDFFYDSTKYFTYIFKDYPIDPSSFNKPYYLILNNAFGGAWGGEKGVDKTAMPQKYFIDYVRYFKKEGSPRQKIDHQIPSVK